MLSKPDNDLSYIPRAYERVEGENHEVVIRHTHAHTHTHTHTEIHMATRTSKSMHIHIHL